MTPSAGWRGRLALAGALALVYAAPLFWPPGPAPWTPNVDVPLIVRLFPGVPPPWVVVRLAALCAAAALLAAGGLPGLPRPFASAAMPPPPRLGGRRVAALVIAGVQAACSPWAAALGPVGQVAYLAALAVPALLLARRGALRRHAPRRGPALAVAVLVLAWMVVALARDVGSPRVANAVDAWRGIVDIHRFAAGPKNLLADPLDPELPGLGAVPLVLLGLPVFQSGLLPLTTPGLQAFQILSLAACAIGLAALARRLVGPGAMLVAVAVFLFAPYTRYVGLVPGPFVAGPIYGTAIALCALAATRLRSESALVLLGALAGVSLTFPGVAPVGGLFAAATVWALRRDWRRVGVGLAAGFAAFVAVVVPAAPGVLQLGRLAQHLGGHGVVGLLEPALFGQLPLGAFAEARAVQVSRPLDVLAGAALLPVAHPRLALRLWGDAIFDPIGGLLVATGLFACVRAARRSAGARWLLLFHLAALCPAFVSPVDLVDVVHAVVLPVPVALLAGVGFAVVRRQLRPARRRHHAAGAAAAAIGIAGTVLFDVVNPRILPSSSMGVLFRALPAGAADRVVVLDYPQDLGIDVRWLFTGAIGALAGPRPLGYLPLDDPALPAAGLAAEGKDVLAWSPGLEHDLGVRDAVCAAWPGASVVEVWDASGLSRVYLAFRHGDGWEPAGLRVRRASCAG